MTADHIKEPHTAIFTGQTEFGKTRLVLELIKKEYNNHFDYIVIIYPTLRENSTYHAKQGKHYLSNKRQLNEKQRHSQLNPKINIIRLHGRFINADLPEDATTANSSTKTREFLKTVDPRYTP